MTTPTGIEALVCADVARRQAVGLKKYKTTVADNPLPLRDWLAHQYFELLDAAIYCRRAMDEIDRATNRLPVGTLVKVPVHGVKSGVITSYEQCTNDCVIVTQTKTGDEFCVLNKHCIPI